MFGLLPVLPMVILGGAALLVAKRRPGTLGLAFPYLVFYVLWGLGMAASSSVHIFGFWQTSSANMNAP